MNLELNHTCQSDLFFEEAKIKMYDSLKNLAQESFIHNIGIRGSGIWVGVCSGLLTIACKVSRVAECLIKGLANIFGSFVSDKCDLWKGVKQIFIQFPSAVFQLLLSPVEAVIGGLITCGGMAISPVEYTAFRKEFHENQAQGFQRISEAGADDDLMTQVNNLLSAPTAEDRQEAIGMLYFR